MCNFVNFSLKPEKDQGNIFHMISDISKYFLNIFVNKTRSWVHEKNLKQRVKFTESQQ